MSSKESLSKTESEAIKPPPDEFPRTQDLTIAPGYGDVTVAALSLAVVYLLATNHPYARPATIAWNLLGILDFVIALVTGVTYIPPFVRQLAIAGASTAYVNYVLIIPAYGVPIMSAFHIYSLHKLFARDAEPAQANR